MEISPAHIPEDAVYATSKTDDPCLFLFRLTILSWTERMMSLRLMDVATSSEVECRIPFPFCGRLIYPIASHFHDLFSVIEDTLGMPLPFSLPGMDINEVMIFSTKPDLKVVPYLFPDLVAHSGGPFLVVFTRRRTVYVRVPDPRAQDSVAEDSMAGEEVRPGVYVTREYVKQQEDVKQQEEGPILPVPGSIVVFPGNINDTEKKRTQIAPEIMSLAGKPIPQSLVSWTDINNMRERLDLKYPWLTSLTEAVLVPMEAKSVLKRSDDKIPVKFAPILVVGPPGIGKTAWASDFAEISKIPHLLISMGGKHTSVGFRSSESEFISSEPSPILVTIARNNCANPLIILDEIDKVGDGKYNGNIQDAALHYFDPMSNKNMYDDFLKVHVNLSGVLWLCTANNIDSLNTPLLDRMTVVTVDYPLPEHGATILTTIIQEFEQSVGVDGENRSLADCIEKCSTKIRDVVDSGIRTRKSLRQIRNDVFRILYEMLLGRNLSFKTPDRRSIGFRTDQLSLG